MDRATSTNSIFVFIFSFVLAILVSSYSFISPLVSVLLVVVGGATLLGEKILNNRLEKEIILVSIGFIAFGLGVLRYDIKDFHIEAVPSSTGIVVSEPEHRDNDTRFVFKSDNGEKVLVSTDMYSPVEYGDRVEVAGSLKKPGIIVSDDGRDFDYAKYLSKDDIYHTMSFAHVEVVSHGKGNPIKQGLLKIKNSFVSKAKEILPEPESSLLAGLVVAGKEAMPESIIEEFRRAGVVHIVVLSGYNITIIAEFLRVLSRSSVVSTFGVIFFVIMTGASATVVRASIMVLIVILSKALRRKFSASRALLVAALLMLVQNPKILVFDPSFQLSFLATAALIFVSPIFEKYLQKVPEKLGFRATLATTLATQVVVFPYLIYSMGNFSIVALPVNILILLFVPLTMLIGFLSVLVSYATPIIALPLTYISHILLAYVLFVAEFFGNLPFASLSIPPVSVWIVIIMYVAMIIYLLRQRIFVRRIASSS